MRALGLGRDVLIIGTSFLAISFMPLTTTAANVIRSVSYFIAFILYGAGMFLISKAIDNRTLSRFSKTLMLGTLITLAGIALGRVVLLIPNTDSALVTQVASASVAVTQVGGGMTLIAFEVLLIYSWHVFRSLFASIRRGFYTLTTISIAALSPPAMYLLLNIITAFANPELLPYETLITLSDLFRITSLIMFASFITLMMAYYRLPDL